MFSADIHISRRIFRGVLLSLLGFSMLFFATIVYYRIAYHDDKKSMSMTEANLFMRADVLQHRALAAISDDAEDLRIANKMFRLGSIHSRIYTQAGYDMLRKKAEQGYEPAVVQLALIENHSVQKH